MMCDLDVLHTTAQRTAAPLPAPSQILRSSFAHPSHILPASPLRATIPAFDHYTDISLTYPTELWVQ